MSLKFLLTNSSMSFQVDKSSRNLLHINCICLFSSIFLSDTSFSWISSYLLSHLYLVFSPVALTLPNPGFWDFPPHSSRCLTVILFMAMASIFTQMLATPEFASPVRTFPKLQISVSSCLVNTLPWKSCRHLDLGVQILIYIFVLEPASAFIFLQTVNSIKRNLRVTLYFSLSTTFYFPLATESMNYCIINYSAVSPHV